MQKYNKSLSELGYDQSKATSGLRINMDNSKYITSTSSKDHEN